MNVTEIAFTEKEKEKEKQINCLPFCASLCCHPSLFSSELCNYEASVHPTASGRDR